MKILATGAAGMLGKEVCPEFKRLGHKVVQADINQRLPEIQKLDVTNSSDVCEQVKKDQPDFVFHLAAETNVDLCQNSLTGLAVLIL